MLIGGNEGKGTHSLLLLASLTLRGGATPTSLTPLVGQNGRNGIVVRHCRRYGGDTPRMSRMSVDVEMPASC